MGSLTGVHLPSSEELKALPPDGGANWNRLVFELSPYLLQHAANPVDWFPWGEAAFAEAKRTNKPIFLSIGYATCHWCHVMAHESFEDEKVAALMNKFFVCIKVDKEERPDIDDIYMTACQVATGHGGWPLTALLTHDKKPFFVGTYFPKQSKPGRVGMLELVPRVGELWKKRGSDLIKDAEELTSYLEDSSKVSPGGKLDGEILKNTASAIMGRFDKTFGGFGGAPKFPTPHNFYLLLRYWKRTEDKRAVEMVSNSLKQMRNGGIFDQVGYGFHRYATDAKWLLPHFEKMLYDQALLALAYLETYQVTGSSVFADTAREIFEYVTRDMTAPEGGFFSAEDADSEGVEGKFYVWRPEEINEVLGLEHGLLFREFFNIVEGGNFEDEASGHKTGDNIPHITRSLEQVAGKLQIDNEVANQSIESSREQLFEVREKRIHPLKDDKVLTDWNGLMIAAFARGARVLDDPAYLQAAGEAVAFALNNLRGNDGKLLKRYRAGQAGLPAHLDDYAFLIWGLIELYQANFDSSILKEAVDLTDLALELFRDQESGAFFFTAEDGETLILRGRKAYDGATPSGNSVMAMNLVALARLTGENRFENRARSLMDAFSGDLASLPGMSNCMVCALDHQLGPSAELVIVVPSGAPLPAEMLNEVNRRFLPSLTVMVKREDDQALAGVAPVTSGMTAIEGKPTAYVCRNHACQTPVTEIALLAAALDEL